MGRLKFLLALIIVSCSAPEEKVKVYEPGQAVEYLVFEVNPSKVKEFTQLEHEIWSQMLSEYPGFISKEIWLNEDKPSEVTVIIYWESVKLWKSVPEDAIMGSIRKFDEAIGAENYKLVEERHLDNKWFKISEFRNTSN
ncbi:MAG: TIGR03792 family protein [bacterium]|nr:TIGR03792 family protein [bacterium]